MPKPRRKDDSSNANRLGITLRELPALLSKQASFVAVVDALKRGQAGAIDGAWGSSAGLVVAAFAQQVDVDKPLIVVLPRMHDVDEFADDVYNFLGDVPAIFPAWESWPPDGSATDAVGGARLRLLRALASKKLPRVIVTSGPALMQPVPGRDEIAASSRTLRVGSDVDVEELLRWLIERGFDRVPAVEMPGEVSVHGGIVDIFPSDSEDPLRLEFFGDELESLRRFDVESQRTIETLNEVSVTALAQRGHESSPLPLGEGGRRPGEGRSVSDVPRRKTADRESPRERASNDDRIPHPSPLPEGEGTGKGNLLTDHLPVGSWIAIIELPELIDEARQYRERLRETTGLSEIDKVIARLTDFANVTVAPIAADSFETSCHLQVESIERFSGPKHEVLHELATVVGRDEQVLIACHNEGERERLAELLAESGELLAIPNRVPLPLGEGGRSPGEGPRATDKRAPPDASEGNSTRKKSECVKQSETLTQPSPKGRRGWIVRHQCDWSIVSCSASAGSTRDFGWWLSGSLCSATMSCSDGRRLLARPSGGEKSSRGRLIALSS